MLRRLAASRRVRGTLALVAVGLGVLAVAQRWEEVRRAAAALHPGPIALALLAVLVGLGASMLSWRVLLADLGSPLPLREALRIFFLGQLGKYLPGSVWWLVGQMELGSDEDVPRRRTATAGVLTVVLSLTAGLALAAGTLPLLATGAAGTYWPALVAVPLLLAVLHPRLLNPLLGAVLRLARREPLERALSGRGLAAALGLAGVTWLAFGAQVAVLAADLGASGPRAAVLSLGAYALAWSVGFLAVVVPAGIGVREAALVAGLAPVLDAGPALVVAGISRVLTTVGDLAWALVAVLARRRVGRPPRRGDRAVTARPSGSAGGVR